MKFTAPRNGPPASSLLQRQARAPRRVEGVVRGVAAEVQDRRCWCAPGWPVAMPASTIESWPRERGAELADGHVLEAVADRAARVVRPRQRPPDPRRAAAALLLVEVELGGHVEGRHAQQRRAVVEPGLREAQRVVAAPAPALEVERQALPVPEHVVVPELEEAGEPGRAGVPGARRGGAHLLLLHLDVDVHVRALRRREVRQHLLEEPEPGELALGAHQRRALEAVALVHLELAPDHLLARHLVAGDVDVADVRGPALAEREGDVHDVRVAHRLLRLDADVQVALLRVRRRTPGPAPSRSSRRRSAPRASPSRAAADRLPSGPRCPSSARRPRGTGGPRPP